MIPEIKLKFEHLLNRQVGNLFLSYEQLIKQFDRIAKDIDNSWFVKIGSCSARTLYIVFGTPTEQLGTILVQVKEMKDAYYYMLTYVNVQWSN